MRGSITGVMLLSMILSVAPASIQARNEGPACRALEEVFDAARAEEDPEIKLSTYRRLAGDGEKAGCNFAAARGHAGVAAFDGFRFSKLALARYHLDRAREFLKRWESGEGSTETHSRQEIEDLEIALATHELDFLFRIGWLDEARRQLERTRGLHRAAAKVSAQKKVMLGIHGSRVLRRLGEAASAEQSLLDAEVFLTEDDPQTLATWRHEFGWVEMARGNRSRAKELFQSALETFPNDDRGKAGIATDLADVAILAGEYDIAASYLESAYELAGQGGGLHLGAHLRHTRARLMESLGEIERAKELADLALDLLDATRDRWSGLGLAYFSGRERYLTHRLNLAIELQDGLDLWRVFERRQARVLLRGVRSRPAPDDRGERDTLSFAFQKSLWQLEQAIGVNPEEKRKLEEHFFSLRSEILGLRVHRSPIEIEHELGVLRVKDAAGLLDEETLGLYFIAGSQSMAILSLELGGRISWVDDMAVGEVEGLTTALFDSWRRGSETEALERRLSDLLFSHLGDPLARFKRLAIVATGPLEGFPFGALPHPSQDRRMISSHEIVQIPSLSVLKALRASKCMAPMGGILALGDPIFSASDPRWPAGLNSKRSRNESWFLRRLESSGVEVENIQKIFGPGVTTLPGAAATKAGFLENAPGYNLLHLATHAVVDAELPERSRLALSCLDEAGRSLADCDLFLPEIEELSLCGQTVVLSACSSASGQKIAGEGVLGLPRAFLEVGAASVIATAWAIEDASAAQLMTIFYRFLSEGAGAAESLRLARAYLAGGGAPISQWAPFIAIGDWHADGAGFVVQPDDPGKSR